jgi:hypothetical protein
VFTSSQPTTTDKPYHAIPEHTALARSLPFHSNVTGCQTSALTLTLSTHYTVVVADVVSGNHTATQAVDIDWKN